MRFISILIPVLTVIGHEGMQKVKAGNTTDPASYNTTDPASYNTTMDPALYKTIETSRGYNYTYYVSPPKAERPFIVFLHGFPSTSKVWHKQLPAFEAQGYGVIAPDLLGYGGTSKPLDAAAYKYSLIAKDVIDILNYEEVQQAVFIGHDWGSRITGRMPQLFPNRTIAAAFLSISYNAPTPSFDYNAVLLQQKEAVGYDFFGYFAFFAAEDEASDIVDEKIGAFWNIAYPEDPAIWVTDFAPSGALKSALLEDKPFPPPSWMTAEERQHGIQALMEGGLKAPCRWFKILTSGLQNEDDQTIPVGRYEVEQPVFFGTALQDFIALAPGGIANTAKYCKNATVREFKTNHWIQLQASDELNQELLSWVEGI